VRPLATAAETFLGPLGVKLIAAGACVSMFGFAAVTMFCAPRYLVALGGDGLLPKKFAHHHPTRATPLTAVTITAIAALLGTLFPLIAVAHHRLFPDAVPMDGAATFERLTALSNLAVLVQYATTCLAVITLSAHRPEDGVGFRLPGGRWPIPLLGLGACAFLAYLIKQDPTWVEQVLLFLAWVALGLLLAALTRRGSSTPRQS
jgi:basic amino acid/polyamine antiporter, APA family